MVVGRVEQWRRDDAGRDAGGGTADRPGAERQHLGERRHPDSARAPRRGEAAEGRVGGGRPAADPRRHRGVGVVEAFEQRAARRRQDRRQCRRRTGRGAVGAQGGAAVRAGAQVLAQSRRVAGADFAVGERREQRRQLGAAAAAVAADEEAAEALAALGHAPVDLGRRKPGDLADLPVGVALGEQRQRAQLLRLQRRQCLAAALDRLVALGVLGRAVGVGGQEGDPVLAARLGGRGGGTGEDPFAVGAHREGLVLDHGLGPADQLARIGGGRLVEEDLEAALQRFVGVIGADRDSGRRSVAGSPGGGRKSRPPPASAPPHRSAPLRAPRPWPRRPGSRRRLRRRLMLPLDIQRGTFVPRIPARTHCSVPPVRFTTPTKHCQGRVRGR